MRHSWKRRRLLVVLTGLALVVAGCGDEEGGDTTTTTGEPVTSSTIPATTSTAEPTTTLATTTTSEAAPTGHVVYFMLEELDTEDGSPGPFLVPVYREAPASGVEAELVMELLLEGPSPDETTGTPMISTAIPAATSLLGVTVDGGGIQRRWRAGHDVLFRRHRTGRPPTT
jgi:hypothetical protein